MAGANPLATTNDDSNTPLHRAAYFGHVSASAVLVAAMASVGEGVDVRNAAGETPLMAAASRGRDEVVGLLVKAGADISATNDDGKSAVELASKRNKATAALLEELAVRARRRTLTQTSFAATPVNNLAWSATRSRDPPSPSSIERAKGSGRSGRTNGERRSGRWCGRAPFGAKRRRGAGRPRADPGDGHRVRPFRIWSAWVLVLLRVRLGCDARSAGGCICMGITACGHDSAEGPCLALL